MESIVTELRNKMEEELAETNAREDLLRQDHQHWKKIKWCHILRLLRRESQDRIYELSAKTDERFLEVSNSQEKEEAKRDEALAELKEELEGLNGKIEEVLDSVGITIQDKLKETSSSFQLKIAQEAQEAQNQRAETDFDIASLKERMESIDQGISEVKNFFEICIVFLQLNEKVYEFEQNKRNNLIFYGLNNEARETPEILIAKIQNIIRVTLGIRRDINLSKVKINSN